jgi:hypothetical protein
MFLIFSLLLFGSCLIEKLSSKQNFQSTSHFLCDENTIIYVQSELKEKIGNQFDTLEDGTLPTTIKVYYDNISKKSLVYQDTKTSSVNTFFFTTNKRGTYYIVLSPETNDDLYKETLGIESRVYIGESNRPVIVSGNDIEVSRAESAIKKILDFLESNLTLQNVEEKDEALYKDLYDSLMRKIFFFMIVRLASIVITIVSSSYKTKKFYASQGVLSAS